MKNIFVTLALASLFFFFESCQKSENQINKEKKETNLEQKPQILKNTEGETITVIYFAKDKEVAAKITINGKVYELSAKGTNAKGDPIFSNADYAWEMMEDGHSGRLTDKNGKIVVFE